MNKPEYIKAQSFSSNNRDQILQSKRCGCFYCLAIFPPDIIEKWQGDDDSNISETAVCPFCNRDSVIGDVSGYPINVNFLQRMYMACFRDIIIE